MTRFPRLPRLLTSLAVIALTISMFMQTTGVQAKSSQSGRASARTQASAHTPRGSQHISRTFVPAVGIPAIQPRAASSSPTAPRFTAGDVYTYLLTASQPSLTPVHGAHLTLESVRFVSDSEATKLMGGEDPGVLGKTLVCVALVTGPFHVTIDQAPGSRNSPTQIVNKVGVVFDAHTGNLLEWAVLDAVQSSSASPAPATPAALSSAQLANQSNVPNISYYCTIHCYGVNYWPNAVDGAYTNLNWPFPYVTLFGHGVGNNEKTSFVQNTMWLLDESEPKKCTPLPGDEPSICWIEAGLRAYDSNGSNATGIFWADVRPSDGYAEHYSWIINTLSTSNAFDIQIWKAGALPGYSWCPSADDEWCVDVYAYGAGVETTSISGAGSTNSMSVTGYRVGMELAGTSGAVATPMYFNENEWLGTGSHNFQYQNNEGDDSRYMYDPPVQSDWSISPLDQNSYGGEWETCIFGSGC